MTAGIALNLAPNEIQNATPDTSRSAALSKAEKNDLFVNALFGVAVFYF